MGIDKKDTTTSLIGTLAHGVVKAYTNNPVKFTWSDGTPTKTESGTTTGIYTSVGGANFTITAPAGVKPLVLRVYVGTYEASSTIMATLSDGSGDYNDGSLTGNGVYTFTYHAKSDGQKITIVF